MHVSCPDADKRWLKIERSKVAHAVRWAALGHAGTAESVARGIADPGLRAQAMVGVVGALAGAGLVDRAEAVARGIAEPSVRAKALQGLVQVLVDAGQPERAAAVAGFIVEQAARPDRSTAVVEPPTVVDVDRSNVRTAIVDPDSGRSVAVQPTGRERLERVRSLTAALVEPDRHLDVLRALAGLADPGRRAEAEAVLAELRTAVRAIPEADRREYALGTLVEVVAGVGRLDLAEPLARAIAVPDRRAAALCVLARRWVRAGRRDTAMPMLAEAETLTTDIVDPGRQARARRDLVRVLAEVGDREHAESVARGIADPAQRDRALAGLARAAAAGGQRDRVVALVRDVADPGRRGRVLAELALRAADERCYAEAEAMAREIPDPGLRVRTLGAVTDRMSRG